MAEPLAVAWSDLSTSSKSAFGWAAAAAAAAQESKDPRVGSGALLFGVMQAHPSNSEPLQLLEYYEGDPKRLIDMAQGMSRERSPFTDSVRAAHRLKEYPEYSTGVRKALDETRRLVGEDTTQGSVSLAHLFGGLLLANATASKALADVLRGKVTLEELRRGYLDYLRAGEEITYRQFLEGSDGRSRRAASAGHTTRGATVRPSPRSRARRAAASSSTAPPPMWSPPPW